MSDGRLRLFVALELPEAAREALAGWAAGVCSDADGLLRPVPAESLHVTLCFLGMTPADRVPGIALACQAVQGFRPVEPTFTRAVWLPRRRPRVLAVELDDPGSRLASIQREIARALVGIGVFEAEARPFLAHVTVARVRRGPGQKARELPQPPGIRFPAGDVILYRSHLGTGPARYEALHRVPLSQG